MLCPETFAQALHFCKKAVHVYEKGIIEYMCMYISMQLLGIFNFQPIWGKMQFPWEPPLGLISLGQPPCLEGMSRRHQAVLCATLLAFR